MYVASISFNYVIEIIIVTPGKSNKTFGAQLDNYCQSYVILAVENFPFLQYVSLLVQP